MLSNSLRRWPNIENIIWYRPLYFNWLNVEGAQKVGRVASDKGPLFNNQDSFVGFSHHVNNWTDVDPHSDPENAE